MASTPSKAIDSSINVDPSITQGDLYSRGFPKRFETYYFFSIVKGKENRMAFSKSLREIASGETPLISNLKKVQQDHKNILQFKQKHGGANTGTNPVSEDDDDGDGPVYSVANALIAFTFSGLEAIQEGLANSDSLDLSTVQDTDPAFSEGPGRPEIVQMMNDPPSTAWDEPFQNPSAPIHGVLKIGGSSEKEVSNLLRKLKETLEHGKTISDVAENSRIDGWTRPKQHRGKEHFGFMDHISQPLMKGIDEINESSPTFSMITEPKLLIVLKDTAKKSREVPRPTWMYNGSFLVFRKLEQDVPGFETLTKKFQTFGCKSKAHMGAKLMGRWETGAPIALAPFHTADSDDPRTAKLMNDFNYNGDICPASAHIRKTNPRNLNKNAKQNFPRCPFAKMIRNGIPYGPEYTGDPADKSKRGLLFACYQGFIEDGFEQIQVEWSNSANFPGAGTGLDPIVGQVKQSSGGINGTLKTSITNLTTGGTASQENLKTVSFQQLVTFRGGGYFFVPSLSALRDSLGRARSGSRAA